MPDFIIGRNPTAGTRLPYVLSLPVAGEAPLVLACGADWPTAKDVYCHPLPGWPDDADVVETHAVAQCWRAGKAVHLVLQRRQRRRSLFVWAPKGDRELIFWRSQRSMGAARPGLKVPAARGLDAPLEIAVDVRERYGWRFGGLQATCVRRELPVGDYGIFADGRLVAAVERKRPEDLASGAVAGTLAFALAELESLPHACLVVEGRFSDLLKVSKDQVRPDWLLSVMAALQLRHPRVAWCFAETRDLAEAYAYRWLAAARKAVDERQAQAAHPAHPAPAGPTVPAAPGPAQLPLPVRDRDGRLSEALALAAAGRVWTSADYAAHFGVTRTTAWQDLVALVEAGALATEGGRKDRRYRRVPPAGA